MFRISTLAAGAALVMSLGAAADKVYDVSITNLTKAQQFTPQLVATHTNHVGIFSLGSAASEQLEILAEGGDTAPVTDLLNSLGDQVADVVTNLVLLDPGQTTTAQVTTSGSRRYLSVASMLIPTNDTFVALNTVRLPNHGERTFYALAYDAGTEANDQNCANIPGPVCGGAGVSEEGGEGYIFVSNGMHELDGGEGEEILDPATYDWRNPVALIRVTRVQ